MPFIFMTKNIKQKKVINNSHKYYIEKITAIYHYQDVDEYVYLVKHDY